MVVAEPGIVRYGREEKPVPNFETHSLLGSGPGKIP